MAQDGDAGKSKISINAYQAFTQKTDRNARAGLAGMDFVFLGLYGEVGSLLSALKKRLRDKEGNVAYKQTVIEELGDVLWYYSSAALRANIVLSDLIDGGSEIMTFSDLQQRRTDDGEIESCLLELASSVGGLIQKYSGRKVEGRERDFADDMGKVMSLLIAAATAADVSLNVAANYNMQKTMSRWPPEDERVWGELYDNDDREEETLPRVIRVEFKEYAIGASKFVIQRCNGITIGDRLTDNSIEDDDYRFHDVFHLAYAAILGWSPVLRALFKAKRKSKRKTDESDDGARAIITEEGIATWIFGHGARHHFYANIDTVDYSLLKAMQDLVRGYEVQNRPLWQWELAILEGFRVFREIRKPENRGGIVTANIDERRITFEPMKNAKC